MALAKNLQAIKNKWRTENLHNKNWRNEPHSFIFNNYLIIYFFFFFFFFFFLYLLVN